MVNIYRQGNSAVDLNRAPMECLFSGVCGIPPDVYAGLLESATIG